MTSQHLDNTSGQGAGHDVPPEIRGRWNWGAFFFTWIWGIANNTWIALVALVPGVNFIMSVLLGVKGSDWAWQNRRFEGGIVQYRAVQRAWALWGWGLTAVLLLPVLLVASLLFAQASRVQSVEAAKVATARTATQTTQDYRRYVKLYDVEAGYEEDILDGRVAVVRGKLKNLGTKTISEVDVKSYFLDAAGQRIYEEDYTPVLVTEFSFGDTGKPLRPGYIRAFAYKAKGCPKEWKKGAVVCEVTGLQFAEQ